MRRIVLIALSWLAQRSPCLARRLGLVGIMMAIVTDGPGKGLPLGVVLALDGL